MTELMQLSGSVIKEESKKRNGLQQEMDMEQLCICKCHVCCRDEMRI